MNKRQEKKLILKILQRMTKYKKEIYRYLFDNIPPKEKVAGNDDVWKRLKEGKPYG